MGDNEMSQSGSVPGMIYLFIGHWNAPVGISIYLISPHVHADSRLPLFNLVFIVHR